MIRDCSEKNSREETFFWFWDRLFLLNFSSNISHRFSTMRWDLIEEDEKWDWRISKLCEEERRLWCCRKSNDLDFSWNMRLKSFMIRCNFWMWDSWRFRTEVRKDESEEVSEQLNDSFLIDCDVILSVAIVRFERFDEMTVLKNVSDSNIWFRDVAKRINEANCEINEQVTADFSTILYANSSVQTRKSEFLTCFRALCSWMCSKSFLLKSKFCLHCLQFARTRAIHWIDAFFIVSDIITNVFNKRFKRDVFNFANKQVMRNRHSTFCSEVSCKQCQHVVDNFCEKDEHAIADFLSDFDVILSLAIERCEFLCETDREEIFAENIWLRDVAEEVDEANCEVSETDEQKIADFSMTLYVNSSAKTRRSKLLTDFRAWFWRKCSWSLLLKLKICLQRLQVVRTQTIRWFDAFFIDFDVFLSVSSVRFESFDETDCKNILVFVTRFLDVAKKIDDFCEENKFAIVDFSSDSHIDLNVKLLKDKLLNEMMNLKNVKNSNICFNRIANKTENDELTVDIFIDSHVELTVSIKRDELTTDFFASIFWCFWAEICSTCEADRVVTFLTADFFSALHTELSAWDRREELMTNFFACCSRLCLRNTSLNLNVCLQCRHVADLFVNSDLVFNARSERFERFSIVIDLNAVANSNIEFWDFADWANNTCVTNDFFLILHTKLIALIERWEFLTSFRTSWLRICSYNFSLKLKFCLQILQIIWTTCWFDAFFIDFDITSSVFNWRFEFFDETRREDVSENVFARALLKRFNEMNSNWILNHSDARSHRHFDNRFSKFDLRYRCWHCLRCCKKIATSLYSSNSDSLHAVESKISIFWSVDVDLTVCFAFEIFLNSFRLTTFETSDMIFNLCCFCEENEQEFVDFSKISQIDSNAEIDCIITDLLEENVFVKIISKSCNEMNFD